MNSRSMPRSPRDPRRHLGRRRDAITMTPARARGHGALGGTGLPTRAESLPGGLSHRLDLLDHHHSALIGAESTIRGTAVQLQERPSASVMAAARPTTSQPARISPIRTRTLATDNPW